MFLSTALQKILAEKETKKSQHAKLRGACEKALAEINEEIGSGKAGDAAAQVGPNSPLPPPQPEDKLVNADKYFTPFRLACESKSPRIIRTALDSLQKLMAYGHVSGNMLAEVEGFPDAMRLVDLIVDIVCRCFTGETTDEGVQLQIIKALLTAVTSVTCEVHEGTLLKAIRTCYNIYLTSKNLVNQTTAKATLTQMVSVVFQRLESLSGNTPTFVHAATNLDAAKEAEAKVQAAATAAAAAATIAAAAAAAATTQETAEPTDEQHDAAQDGQDTISVATSEGHPETDGEPEGAASAAAPAAAAPAPAPAAPATSTTPTPAPTPAPSSAAAAAAPAAAAAAPSHHGEDGGDQGVAYLDMETETDTLHASGSSGVDAKFGHIYRKDAFLVFRSMCKLSMKDLPADRELIDPRSHDLRSKLLSLELQLSILQNAGPGFQKDPLFIDAIKQYLCVALSKNGVSHIPTVFELTLAIFLMLLSKFRSHLKVQVEVFFREILLSMLEITTSSFQHKWLVMVCLAKITADAQMVVDIYVNYDCDEFRTNIFERMVANLSRISQGRPTADVGTTPAQEQNMRKKGLECLHAIVKALDRWSSQLCEEAQVDSEDASARADGPDLNESRSEPAAVPTTGVAAAGEFNEIEARKVRKELREEGIELFNQKPKKGVAFMQKHGFIGPAHEDVAAFFLHEERLDRAAIGEYLGEPGEYELATMHKYVDLIDFKECKKFLDALRLFLGNFRLPGESQKIDRLMEKFAQRYCEVHKDQRIFASADAAYVLAYSVIMLTTDLHNVKVKKKITLEDFLKMTRGINDSKDLPAEFVTEIYHDIAKQEIVLKSGAQKAPVQNVDMTNVKARQAIHNEEMTKLASNVTEAMHRAVQGGEGFTTATHMDLVRPMFKVINKQLLEGFTVPLSTSTDDAISDLCLEGMRTSVHIACIFGLEQERNAFVQSLAKFTSLTSELNSLKQKSVGAIKNILDIGVNEGNFLGEAWKDVLTVVSQLEQASVIGSSSASSSSKAKARSQYLSDTASQEIVVATDRIFARTVKLDGNAIVDFVKALCAVSMDELLNETPPRMYSLAKMVEIAYYNMERIRLEWSHIWAVMGEHFNKAGCLANAEVAFFAVDSLRQLSIKFLEKGELANYTFQKDFLKPFEYIMNHNKAVPIRDMVVRCVAQMVQAKANNIRSGWKNIFFVFLLAASDTDQNIVELAFSTTKHIFDNFFAKKHDHRASLINTSFMDAVNCMAEFACNSFFPEISMESIRQLRRCATTVSEAPELFVDPNEDQSDEPKIWVKGWFPVLFGLSRIVNRCKMDVRTRALTVMFEIMKTYGHLFSSQWWSDLFSVVFRIFDDKKLQGMATEQERVEWMKTTCTHALRSIIDVVSLHFEVLQVAVLADLFQLLQWCIHRDNEQLASAGTECLNLLVLNNGQRFSDKSWQMTCDTIRDLFESTAPKELMTFRIEDSIEDGETDVEKKDKFEKLKQTWRPLFNSIIIKCVVQLELIQTVEWILLSSTKPESHGAPAAKAPGDKEGGDKQAQQMDPAEFNQRRLEYYRKATDKPLDRAGEMFECLTSERIILLLDCLMRSHEFGKTFNSNSELRTALWKAGFMKNRSKPNLLNQETLSLSCALRIMYRIIENESRKDIWAEIDTRVMNLSRSTLVHFVTSVQKETRSIWAPLVVLILREVVGLKEELFVKHATFLYESACDVMTLSFDSALGDMAFLLGAFFTRARKCSL